MLNKYKAFSPRHTSNRRRTSTSIYDLVICTPGETLQTGCVINVLLEWFMRKTDGVMKASGIREPDFDLY